MVRMSYNEAQAAQRNYVCSACWGELDYRQDNPDDCRDVSVFCFSCKDQTPGFVSRKHAEWEAGESARLYEIAKRALRDSLPWLRRPPLNLTQEQIMRQLGY